MDSPRQALNIMLVDDQPPRAALLARSLEDSGQRVLCRLTRASGLLEKILTLHPDLVLVDMDAPDRDVLESASVADRALEAVPRPLVTITGVGEATVVTALVAGVSVYASEGLEPSSVRAVVIQAAARYREYRALREALGQGAGDAATERVVECARALLMSRRRIGERDADAALRRQAMRTGGPLSRVARTLLDCAELLKAGARR